MTISVKTLLRLPARRNRQLPDSFKMVPGRALARDPVAFAAALEVLG